MIAILFLQYISQICKISVSYELLFPILWIIFKQQIFFEIREYVYPRDATAREHALESSMGKLADSPSCIRVSARRRRRGSRYLPGDLPTICQRSTGRVPALSNIYIKHRSRRMFTARSDREGARKFFPHDPIRIFAHFSSSCRIACWILLVPLFKLNFNDVCWLV